MQKAAMQHFNSFLEEHILPEQEAKFAIACSGGGDSMALALMMLEKLPPENLVILHFNHNLRPESTDEAHWVEKAFKQHGLQTIIGKWEEAPTGNTMQEARHARYIFFAKQAKKLNLKAILTAHTADDVAETFLMRMGKGSGLKGLSAMLSIAKIENTAIYRPLLHETRESLREYLSKNGQEWLEDPSNENLKYARPRMRHLKTTLEEAGIPFESITASAFSLQRAAQAIQFQVDEFWQTIQKSETEIFAPFTILSLPEETALQVLEKVILTLKPAPFAPRTTKRNRMLNAMKSNNKHEAGGVQVSPAVGGFIFSKSQPDNS